MNIEALKQSFARIQKWIKANPKTAAVIGVALGIVAYLAIKQGAKDTGAGSQSIDSPGLDSLASENVTESNALSDLFGSGGASAESQQSSISQPSGFELGLSDSGFSGFSDIQPSDFLGGFAPTDFINTSAPSPIQDMPASTTPKPTGITLDKIAANPGKSIAQVVANATPKPAGITLEKIAANPGKSIAQVVAKTDAEKYGLSKYFSGTSQGYIFVLGRITGKAPSATTKQKPISTGVKGTVKLK